MREANEMLSEAGEAFEEKSVEIQKVLTALSLLRSFSIGVFVASRRKQPLEGGEQRLGAPQKRHSRYSTQRQITVKALAKAKRESKQFSV